MAKKSVAECDLDKAIQAIGELIDVSCDLSKKEGLTQAIEQANLMLSKNLNEIQKSTLYYFIGTACSGLRALKHRTTEKVWDWEQTEIENEILNFRLFNCCIETGSNNPYFCQTNTNLGNTLSHVGRFVEAITYWNEVLRYNSSFGMALANKGYGLISYARLLCDEGHAGLFLKFAHSFLKQGLKSNEIHSGARKEFEHAIQNVEARVSKGFLERPFDMNQFSLGESDAERRYRKWCLDDHLFLNPLNDLGCHNIAANDILSCSTLYTSIEETSSCPPVYFGFYNQLKQEYVSARFLLYESIQNKTPHYSDSDVKLYNTLDYPCYGLNPEKAKIAFRMSYSIFDKIAYFINEYLKLRVPEKKVTFKTIWYKKQKMSLGLRDEFLGFKNLPLRGLFWLAKDLSENRSEFRNSIEPDAQDLVRIRNYLEHKYLTMTEYEMFDVREFSDSQQQKVHRITRDDFFQKTLKLLKLTRAALIYLSLGVNIEEREKMSKVDGIIAPMLLDTWEDDWKI